LEQDVQEFQAQIASNVGDIDALTIKVDDNNAMITTLQFTVTAVENNIISLGESLQGQIDANKTKIIIIQGEINSINDVLEEKQNLIHGTCPDGQAVQRVLSDGSVICNEVGGGVGTGGGSLVTNSANNVIFLQAYEVNMVQATCDEGFLATGVGYANWDGIDVEKLFTSGPTGFMYVRDIAGVLNIAIIKVTCAKIQ